MEKGEAALIILAIHRPDMGGGAGGDECGVQPHPRVDEARAGLAGAPHFDVHGGRQLQRTGGGPGVRAQEPQRGLRRCWWLLLNWPSPSRRIAR